MNDLVDQAPRQVDAANGKHIVWVFAQKAAMDDVKETFDGISKLRGRIQFDYEPWGRSRT